MKKNGISLIVLIITIVIIIILATAIIVNIAKTNIIGNAKKAISKQDMSILEDELALYLSDMYVEKLGKFDKTKLNANKNTATYKGQIIEDKNSDGKSNIFDILNSLENSKYGDNISIVEGNIVFTEVAGLYDEYGQFICTWEESGIDVETNYTSSTFYEETTSACYVITNMYPSTTKVIIPDNVTSIGDFSFAACINLTSVQIPDSITSIGQWAFGYCIGLNSIEIPSSVISIGYEAFVGCTALNSVKILGSETYIGEAAFSDCSNLTDVEMQEGITSIDSGAFNKCSSLTSIKIPETVTSLGLGVFWKCSSLTSIEVPYGITRIENNTFAKCSSLTSIIIPDSVTSIGRCAFESCEELTTVYYTGTEEQWDNVLIGVSNSYLENATIICNYVAE